jgi:hypothetical protein
MYTWNKRQVTMTSRRLSHIRLFLILAAALIGFYTGCGIKDLPVPPPQYRPPAVNDLRFSLENGRLHLAWTAPSTTEKTKFKLSGCSVYRSVRPLSDGDCKNCPVPYEKVADVPAVSTRTNDPSSVEMSYHETLTVNADYSYKVVCFSKEGAAGDGSNVVNFIY